MANGQFVENNIYQASSDVCVVDLTPPTFAGVSSVDQRTNGALRVNFPAATDVTGPISYDIFVAEGTSVPSGTLYQPENIVDSPRPSGAGPYFKDVLALQDGTYLAIQGDYTIGVRARDGVGNTSSNTSTITQTSLGVIPDGFQIIYADLTAQIAALEAANAQLQVYVAQIQNAANLLLATVL